MNNCTISWHVVVRETKPEKKTKKQNGRTIRGDQILYPSDKIFWIFRGMNPFGREPENLSAAAHFASSWATELAFIDTFLAAQLWIELGSSAMSFMISLVFQKGLEMPSTWVMMSRGSPSKQPWQIILALQLITGAQYNELQQTNILFKIYYLFFRLKVA